MRKAREPLRVVSAAAILLGCAAALTCSRSSDLQAQQVQLRPQAGLYLPTRISLQNGVLHVRQKVGVTVGARLTLTFNERFDAVSVVTYLPGYAMFRGAGKRLDTGTSAHLLTVTTGARYWLLPRFRSLSWEAHTLLGAAFGGQPAYEDFFESSMVSGTLGTTVHYRIGRIASLKLGIQERLYRVGFGGRRAGSAKPPLQISFGLALPFVESARLARNPTSQMAARDEPPVPSSLGLHRTGHDSERQQRD